MILLTHPKDFELIRRPKKSLIPNFSNGHEHQNIFSQYKSKPSWFLSFFCAPWQDVALFKSITICSLSLIVLSKIKGVGIVYMEMGGQNESALIITHAYAAKLCSDNQQP